MTSPPGTPVNSEVGVEIQPKIGEACGIFGIYDPNGLDSNVTSAYRAAFVQQHRGQETGGISVSTSDGISRRTGFDKISAVFPNPDSLETLGRGIIASSHVRYGTIGTSDPELAGQPILRKDFTISHNGHWQSWVLDELGIDDKGTTDTERVADYLAQNRIESESMEQTLNKTLPKLLPGAFSLVITTPNQLFAVRDPLGFRPLMLGKIGASGFAVASETIALDVNGIDYSREIRPGEMLTVDDKGIRSSSPFGSQDSKNQNLCSFELGYFSSPASRIGGREVYSYRRELGRALFRQDDEKLDGFKPDLVMGVPDSGVPAGEGYAEESGVPYSSGMMKNRYTGRTFIMPSDLDRAQAVNMKLFPYRDQIEGKKIVLVDDSIVRGNTTRELVKMSFEAGAAEVHVRSAMPQYISGCYMGMDTYDETDLLAARLGGDLGAMREEINSTSLDFLELETMKRILGKNAVGLCTSCMTGDYPIKIRKN